MKAPATRSKERPTRADRAALRFRTPHLVQSGRIAAALRHANERLALTSSTLDALGPAMLVLDDDAHVRFANRAADALLATVHALTVRRGRLHARDVATDRTLADVIVRVARGAQVTSFPVQASRPARTLVLRLVPLMGDHAGEPGQVLALLVDPARAFGTHPQLATIFGLTPAESALAEHVLAGGTLECFAARRGVALLTARSQLRTLFRKTGTDRQTQLVRRLAATARLVGR